MTESQTRKLSSPKHVFPARSRTEEAEARGLVDGPVQMASNGPVISPSDYGAQGLGGNTVPLSMRVDGWP
jgi:hypothetical protein